MASKDDNSTLVKASNDTLLSSLPVEMLCFIFFFLPGDKLLELRRVCKGWDDILEIDWNTLINVYDPRWSRKSSSRREGGRRVGKRMVQDADRRYRQDLDLRESDSAGEDEDELQAMLRTLSVAHAAQLQREGQRRDQRVKKRRADSSRTLLPGTQGMKNEKFWLLLCETQFGTAMRFRKRYPSLMRVMLFYFQHLNESVIQTDIYHQEIILESLERHLEGLKARSLAQHPFRLTNGNRWFLDVCIFCPDTFDLLLRAYRIQKHVENMRHAEHAFNVIGLNQGNIVQPPSLKSPHEEFGKKKLIAIVRPNEEVISQHYWNWWQKYKQERYANTHNAPDLSEREIKDLMVSQLLNRQLQKWIKKNRVSLLLRAHRYNVIFSSEYDLSSLDVVYTTEGFTRDNFLRSATGKVKRSTIYGLFVQDNLQ